MTLGNSCNVHDENDVDGVAVAGVEMFFDEMFMEKSMIMFLMKMMASSSARE